MTTPNVSPVSAEELKRDLIDDDGENRAVRSFLAMYGGNTSVTTQQMRNHLAMSGFEDLWPDWTIQDMHLTKGGAQDWIRYLFSLEPKAPDATTDLLLALQGITPLKEPVHITKALRAGREARVCLSGGTGPLACVMLVNIQLTPWIHTEDTAKAFADGYNKALEQLRAALLEVAEQGSRPTAANAAEHGDGELQFNATRLRNVARLVGLESAVPKDDATLDGARGSVLGMIAGKLRESNVVTHARLTALTETWRKRAADALPADAMLINKHVRELKEAYFDDSSAAKGAGGQNG